MSVVFCFMSVVFCFMSVVFLFYECSFFVFNITKNKKYDNINTKNIKYYHHIFITLARSTIIVIFLYDI